MSLVTVAIPYVGGAELLDRQLRSLVAQRDRSWRAIVVVGGPEGADARVVIDRLGDERIDVEPWDGTLGIGATWNRCLDLGEGELVVIAHADDELLPRFVERVRAGAATAPGSVAVATRAEVIDLDGATRRGLPELAKAVIGPRGEPGPIIEQGQRALTRLMVGQWIVCPAVAYRRELLGARRFPTHLQQALDLELFSRLLLDGESIVAVPDVVYRYRRHRGSQTARTTASGLRFLEEAALHRAVALAAWRRRWPLAAAMAVVRPTSRANRWFTGAAQCAQRWRTRAHRLRRGAL